VVVDLAAVDLERAARGVDAALSCQRSRHSFDSTHVCGLHGLARVQAGEDAGQYVAGEVVDPWFRPRNARWGHDHRTRRLFHGLGVARHFVEQVVLEQAAARRKWRITVRNESVERNGDRNGDGATDSNR
jgi:hypothetical protein